MDFDSAFHSEICDNIRQPLERSMDDLTTTAVTRPQASISDEERARRQAADEYARASMRLEGFVPSKFSDEATRRYIDGEITRAELTALICAHHGQ
jgi:hypothetical protein